MKKLLVFIATLSFTICLGACSTLRNKNSSNDENLSASLSFTARYDYGFHVQNTPTLLLNDSVFLFDPADYSLSTILAGDVVTIEYEGEFLIRETYPSTVVTNNLVIKNVTVTEAGIVAFEVMQNPGGGVSLAPKDDGVSVSKFNFPNQYVIDADMTYKPLQENHFGKTIYGTYVADKDTIEIEALYSYYPRNTVEFGCASQEQPHVCAHVCLEEIEATCREEGLLVIGCTYCGEEYERTVLPVVECVFENGKCKFCGTNAPPVNDHDPIPTLFNESGY